MFLEAGLSGVTQDWKDAVHFLALGPELSTDVGAQTIIESGLL